MKCLEERKRKESIEILRGELAESNEYMKLNDHTGLIETVTFEPEIVRAVKELRKKVFLKLDEEQQQKYKSDHEDLLKEDNEEQEDNEQNNNS